MTRTKVIITIICLLAFATSAQAGNVDFYSDGTIEDGDVYNEVRVYDTPPEHTVVDMYGGSVGSLRTYDLSTVNIYGGELEQAIETYDSSQVNIYGGSGLVGLYMRGESTLNIYGGNVSLNYSAPWVLDSSELNIYGYGFDFDGFTLTGFLCDGSAFEYLELTYAISNMNLIEVPKSPTTYYVNAADGSDDNDGLSPETAFATIQKAIDAAYDGDTVIVADGTYTGDGNRDIDFLGKAITVRSESGPENCIIDCNGTVSAQHRGFYFHNGEDANSVLDGFTITKGYAEFSGSGIDCRNANPTINNCVITGNASRDGAALVCRSSAMVNNCTVVENTDKGISCFGGTIITNCVINKNTDSGISCGETTITNCTISENEDDGIRCRQTTIRSCTVTGNRGAGFWCNDNATIRNCVIDENNSGGVVFSGENSKIISSLIMHNRSWSGGGIRCAYERGITVTNCTISDNTAEENGGAIFCQGSTLSVSNSILWNNMAPRGSEICVSGNLYYPSGVSISYDNVQGGEDSVYVGSYGSLNWTHGNIDTDPCFVEAGYWDVNGVWVEGDYRLLVTSRCIDAGDPNYVSEPDETDLDGNPRVLDGDEDGTAVVDMGAYELWPAIEARMRLTPQTVNCAAKGKYIKAHIILPEEIFPEDIDVNTPAVADPPNVDSEYIKILGGDTGPVKLEIAFSRQAFCAELTEPGQIEVTVFGYLKTGREFYASDTITIKKTTTKLKPINQAQPARRLRLIK